MVTTATREMTSLTAGECRFVRRQVRAWFAVHGRDFSWRRTDDPFKILIAELLLQRTRADLVPGVYGRFIRRYSDARQLAAADAEEVVDLLRPLGLRHRSARLPSLGREICDRFHGRVPETVADLTSLPGVGRYVANAVSVLAFNRRQALLDPNVLRVVERCFGIVSRRARARDDKMLWEVVEGVVPLRDPRPVALGLIDLGALVCRPRRPRCRSCPLGTRCRAFQDGRVTPSE